MRVISDYTKQLEIRLDHRLLFPRDLDWSGCYAHFYKFNCNDIKKNGILGMRSKDKINVAYLPSDYPIWVRNMDANKQDIISFYKMIQNPEDHTWHKFPQPQTLGNYNWIKMPLSIAVQRTDEYLSVNDYDAPCEAMSEAFLTAEDIKQLLGIKRYWHWWPIERWTTKMRTGIPG